MKKMITDNGQEVYVLSSKDRYWWVQGVVNGKRFTINKNKLNEIGKAES